MSEKNLEEEIENKNLGKLDQIKLELNRDYDYFSSEREEVSDGIDNNCFCSVDDDLIISYGKYCKCAGAYQAMFNTDFSESQNKFNSGNKMFLKKLFKPIKRILEILGIKNNLVGYLAVATLVLSMGVSGCGKSYCCKHLSCGSNYICEDTISENYCIKDAEGRLLECCECVPYEPPDNRGR